MNVNVYSEGLVSILRKLSMIYFYVEKYDEDIKCCDFALRQFGDKLSEQYRSVFLYNSALCYWRLKKYSIALERLAKLETMVRDSRKHRQRSADIKTFS